MKPFTPHHINATPEDFAGNNGIGRYVFLPGSDGRAREISQYFENCIIKSHPREHNLYLGTMKANNQTIDVAAVATGMGGPSVEIIMHELFHLGAKRFLRVGTAGSMQPPQVKLGDLVIANAAVRDERASLDYAPIEVPAVASLEYTLTLMEAASSLKLADRTHVGIAHCKSSLYAREYAVGPQGAENKRYTDVLVNCGVMATEMETAQLFIQSQVYNHLLNQQGLGPQHKVITGAILGIIAVPPEEFAGGEIVTETTSRLINLALEATRLLALQECNHNIVPLASSG